MEEPKFRIFISYARKDDHKPPEEREGWVQFFDNALRLELQGRGLEIDFWRDIRDIDRNDFWDDEIQEGIDGSDVLLAVVSPNWVRRPYCLRELSEFLDSVASRRQGRPASHVYKVLIRPVPQEDQPEPMHGKEGFPFFSYDRERGRVQHYFQGYGRIVRDAYWDVMDELGSSLEAHLGVTAEADSGTDAPTRETVYLAEVSHDRLDDYRSLQRELKGLGFRIVPEAPLPRIEEEARGVAAGGIEESVLSIHLLGSTSGFTPEGRSQIPIVPLQLESAAEKARESNGFKRLIWLPLELRCESDRQARLVAGLNDGRDLLSTDELVREPLQKFLEMTIDSLPSAGPAGGGRSPTVVILCEREDEGRGLDLQQILVDHGLEAILPVFAAPEEERAAAEREDLGIAQGAVVIYSDEGRERWVRAQLDRLADYRALGRERELGVVAVCLMGAPSLRKERFKTTRAGHILRAFDEISGAAVATAPEAPQGLDGFAAELADHRDG